MTVVKRKRFNRILFKEFDERAKSFLDNHLGEGWSRNEDRYGPDFVHTDSSRFSEVEIKWVWSGSDFPYADVQLPERKGKWRDLDLDFYILNREGTHAVKFHASVLTDELLREVPNRYVPKGEYFFAIPLTSCEIIKL